MKGGASPTTRPCRICGKTTSELKPYCVQHIGHHDHAAEVREELARRGEEINLAEKGQVAHILVDGSVAEDVLQIVAAGERDGCTISRIMRVMNFSLRCARSYVSALKRAKRVSILKVPGRADRVLYIEGSETDPLPDFSSCGEAAGSPRGVGASLPLAAAQADGLADLSVAVEPELAEEPGDHPDPPSP